MSAKFYGYRIKREQLWPLVKLIREYYSTESPLMAAVLELREETLRLDDIEQRLELSTRAFERLQEQHGEQLEVELQIFDDGPEHLIFRVLEHGDQFRTSYKERGWEVEEVFYDDSAGVGEPESLPTVERLDKQIEDREYLITPVVTIQDATMILYDYNKESTGGPR